MVRDDDSRSVELRRITLTRPGEGLGERVLALLDEHARTLLGCRRIWLDVFGARPVFGGRPGFLFISSITCRK